MKEDQFGFKVYRYFSSKLSGVELLPLEILLIFFPTHITDNL